MQNNWGLSFSLTIQADDEESILDLIREVRKRIKKGNLAGIENHCTGQYQYSLTSSESMDDIQTEAIRGLLSLAEVYLPESVIAGWSAEQRSEAKAWAANVHLQASDNDVKVPSKPAFVTEAEAQHGMTLEEFQESW